MKLLLATVLAATLTACATPTSSTVAAKWVGRPIAEAVSELGPPQATTPLPGGVVIYTWEKQYGSAIAVQRATCRTGLHANQAGMIVSASQLSESLLCK